METNRILMFLCMTLWVLSTFTILILQVLRPEPMYGSLKPVKNIRHHLMIFSIQCWITMWLFRFLPE